MKKIIKNLTKQKYMLLMILMLMAHLTYAAQVSEQQANLVAVNFLKSTTGLASFKAVLNYKQVEPDGSVDFYVFNFLSYKGFVIVTGEDNLEPVIAYSTESSFDINAAKHTGVSDWMNDGQKQIQEALKLKVKADSRVSNLWSAYLNGSQIMSPQSASVPPLLTTKWDQWQYVNSTQYYNSLCPFDATANMRCPTGCVATAMAQIMKYWNYPAHGNGSRSYTCGSYGTLSANFGATTYNWSQMPDEMTSTSTHDVDILMYQCGVSVDMAYSPTNSGAYVFPDFWNDANAMDAYVVNFGYRNSIQEVHASDYSSSAWIALLENELNAKRPIQYVGDNNTVGHTWVCDGYDVNNWFHMNWGWGGGPNCLNGYFCLTDLTPGTTHNYNSNQAALIGIWPGTLSDCDSYWNLTGNQISDFTWQASDHITSSMTIPSNLHTAYTAANQITLSPGFHASANSNFSAKIQTCITYKLGDIPSEGATEKTDEENLSVYPNPFSDKFTVEFDLSKDDDASIKLFDLMGKELKTISKSFFNEGKYDVSVDASDLPSGIYFVVLKSAEFRKEQKIIKVN